MSRNFKSLIAVLLSTLVIGCSSEFVKARGKVLVNGQPFEPKPGQRLGVGVYPIQDGEDKPTDGYPANVNLKTSEFVVPGKTGKGVRPGKYRVAVEIGAGPELIDSLKGKLNWENSPFIVDITSDDEIEIDIGPHVGG